MITELSYCCPIDEGVYSLDLTNFSGGLLHTLQSCFLHILLSSQDISLKIYLTNFLVVGRVLYLKHQTMLLYGLSW